MQKVDAEIRRIIDKQYARRAQAASRRTATRSRRWPRRCSSGRPRRRADRRHHGGQAAAPAEAVSAASSTPPQRRRPTARKGATAPAADRLSGGPALRRVRSCRWIAPLVMGVVNVTPDSFSDGGQFLDPAGGDRARAAPDRRGRRHPRHRRRIHAARCRRPLRKRRNCARVLPVLESSCKIVPVSVDTRQPEVMRAALAAGASMINDIEALRRPARSRRWPRADCAVCLMHKQGEPRDHAAATPLRRRGRRGRSVPERRESPPAKAPASRASASSSIRASASARRSRTIRAAARPAGAGGPGRAGPRGLVAQVDAGDDHRAAGGRAPGGQPGRRFARGAGRGENTAGARREGDPRRDRGLAGLAKQ